MQSHHIEVAQGDIFMRFGLILHTAGSDTIFFQIYMDPPPGVPEVSKNSQKYATNKSVEFLR